MERGPTPFILDPFLGIPLKKQNLRPPSLMGEGFMGCTPPFKIFFDFRLRSLRYEKDFLPVLSKLSQASMVKIFHFSDERKVVSVYTPPINLEVFFTHILATATRLNTLYGLETLHAQSSRHVGITQKVLRHIRHF